MSIQQSERIKDKNSSKAAKLKSGNEESLQIFRQGKPSRIVASSESMKKIFQLVGRLATFNTTVMITGESGTGKELIARAIHCSSTRKDKPFIAINCGAIPESLIESELFGHKKGSFTDASRDKTGLFAEANGGTIFLDEIGDLPQHLQSKLLRALQEQVIRPVGAEQDVAIDVRVIAATLKNLEDEVKKNRFRDDLFYRLNVVSIHLPPLRERKEDIPVLIEHFIAKHGKKLDLKIVGIDEEVMTCLETYGWRGNVRELENCIERALVFNQTNTLTLDSLPQHIRAALSEATDESGCEEDDIDENDLSIKRRTRALEVMLIKKVLMKTNGNRTHAAKILQISHRALLYKLKDYGLADPPKKRHYNSDEFN